MFLVKQLDVINEYKAIKAVQIELYGNILVDGVLASCYASIDHELAHIGMTAMRWFPEITKWIFGEESQIAASTAKPLGKWLFLNGQFWSK